MDVGLLSRIQFAVTVGFHFLFPPITIGLAWMLVIVEGLAWRKKDPVYERAGQLFGRLLGLTFAVGVATGIVMEFQFGTNWAKYSKFVGDIFGAPLAAEGLFAFFLESAFLGVYLFARKRIGKGLHWGAIVLVAIGATLSAFWIIVANSWMQTPAGYTYNATTGRAELTDFWAAVFNPSTTIRYLHVLAASVVAGAFFMAGCAAYILLRSGKKLGLSPDEGAQPAARKALGISVVIALLASVVTAFPTGDMHAKQVAKTQPEKLAAMEALYTSRTEAPLVVFGILDEQEKRVKVKIEVPYALSLLAFGDKNAKVRGIEEFPADEIPPLWLTFVSFHNMVLLGSLFIAVSAWGIWRLRGGKLFKGRKTLWLILIVSWLPLAACQFGWVTAEVGRQPWIVYKLMRTADAFSANVTAGQVWFSLILFGAIYLLLLVLYLTLLVRNLRAAAQPAPAANEED